MILILETFISGPILDSVLYLHYLLSLFRGVYKLCALTRVGCPKMYQIRLSFNSKGTKIFATFAKIFAT